MLPKSSSHSAIQLLCPFLDKSQKLALAQFSDFPAFPSCCRWQQRVLAGKTAVLALSAPLQFSFKFPMLRIIYKMLIWRHPSCART